MDFALSPWCRPIAYCERIISAVAALRARMADGALPPAVVLPDVRSVMRRDVPGHVDGIVAGFPCIDFSQAGAQRGVHGDHGGLLWEALRLADATECWFLFLENVDHLRFHSAAWRPLLAELDVRGFETRWLALPAWSVGAPQKRTRWFALSVRGTHTASSFADALVRPSIFAASNATDREDNLQEICQTMFRTESGTRFNAPGRPPVHQWMIPRAAYAGLTAERLKMLGNAVVPLQAYFAARLLAG